MVGGPLVGDYQVDKLNMLRFEHKVYSYTTQSQTTIIVLTWVGPVGFCVGPVVGLTDGDIVGACVRS